MNLKRLLLTLIGIGGIYSGFAQNLLGIANSNYAGTNALYLNPAGIADNRYAFYFNFFTTDAFLNNNRFAWQGPNLGQVLESGFEFKEEYLKENSTGKAINFGADVRGPAFLVRINENHSFALSSRGRVLVNGNNISSNIFSLLRTGIDDNSLLGQNFNNSTFNLNTNAFTEYAITYARKVLDLERHYLKAGFTFKYLKGVYSAQLLAQDIDYQIQVNLQQPSENIFRINNLNGKVIYSGDAALQDIQGSDFLPGGNSLGNGLGVDFGFMYEFRPDIEEYAYNEDGEGKMNHRANKYKLRVGLSLMDIGGVRYNTTQTRVYNINVQNKSLTQDNLEDIQDPAALMKDLGVDLSKYDNSFRSSLPTTLNFTVDYRLANKVFTNFTLIQNLRGTQASGMRQGSMLGITPRLELRGLEVALPLSLVNNYSKFALGLAFKLGPLQIGSDNLLGVFNSGNPYGANAYVGLGFGIYNKKKAKDQDGDGVSDKEDKCPDVKGLAKFKGCPDTDEDGIPDSEDACPQEAGSPENKGCPENKN